MMFFAMNDEVEDQSWLFFVERKRAAVRKKYYSLVSEEMIWEYVSGFTGTDYLLD